MNVLDSSCWIEFFLNSASAPHVSAVIEDTGNLIVPSIALFEVHKFLSRQLIRSENFSDCLNLMRRSRVIDLTDERAIAASQISQKNKLAMADAVMYSTALEFNATFWTQDSDYKGLPSVQYFAKEKSLSSELTKHSKA
jgi:predicted nucleic acid-binding protein